MLLLFVSGGGTILHGADFTAGGYRLGAGDVVQVTVLAGGEVQISTELVVSGSGDMNIPLVGAIRAEGLTQELLEQAIRIPLERDYFVNPQVQVQIKAYHSLQFFISGAVKSPGMFELNFNPSIMDLIAKAGGVSPDRGNVAYILRGTKGGGAEALLAATADADSFESTLAKKEPIRVDLLKLLDQGDMTENIPLVSGDTVYIPLGKALNQTFTKVFVEGEVKSPGVFDYQPGLTAFGACIMAGGFAKYAAPNRARIIRNTGSGKQKIFKINLEKVQRGAIADFPLAPGDRIFIPESWL
jgi:polysaccharide export outer membrane protein